MRESGNGETEIRVKKPAASWAGTGCSPPWWILKPGCFHARWLASLRDRIDALALCQRLDRYVRGNRKAFSVVRVPSEEEERERAISRQRQQLVRERTGVRGGRKFA